VALDLISLLVAGAGAGWGYLSLRRYGRNRDRNGLAELESAFDADAAVAFSVAMHAMKSRDHQAMHPVHLVYGLIQDETFAGAVKRVGGDVEAIESGLLTRLEEREPDNHAARTTAGVLNFVYAVAKQSNRKITVCDLWAAIVRTEYTALAGVDKVDLLFVLAHGMPQPAPDLPGRTDVQVILRNDNYTTFEHVIAMLVDVFAMTGDEAKARAAEVHQNGSASLGRFKLQVARDRVITARSRAREKAFPLWIALEDV
jgi:ATP-dependent Clp protease adapter protein ClpS